MNTAAVLECGECGIAYVLRVYMRLTGGNCYAFAPDCRCKKRRRKKSESPCPPPVVRRDEHGEVVRIEVMSSDEDEPVDAK